MSSREIAVNAGRGTTTFRRFETGVRTGLQKVHTIFRAQNTETNKQRDGLSRRWLLGGGLALGATAALSEGLRIPRGVSEKITTPHGNIKVEYGNHALGIWPEWMPFIPKAQDIEKKFENGDLSASDWPSGINGEVNHDLQLVKASGRDVALIAMDSDGSLTASSNYPWAVHIDLQHPELYPKYIVSIGTEIPDTFDIGTEFNYTRSQNRQAKQLARDVQYHFNDYTAHSTSLELQRIVDLGSVDFLEGVAAVGLTAAAVKVLNTNPEQSRRVFLKNVGRGVAAFEAAKFVSQQGYVEDIALGEISNPRLQRALIELQTLTDHPEFGNYIMLKTQARTAMAIQMLEDTQTSFPQMAQELDIPFDTKGVINPPGFALWGSMHADPRLNDKTHREAVIKAYAQNVLGYVDWSIRYKYPDLKKYRDSILSNVVWSFTSPGASVINYPIGSPEHIKGPPENVLKDTIVRELGPRGMHLLEETSEGEANQLINTEVKREEQESLRKQVQGIAWNLEGDSVGLPTQTVSDWVHEVAREQFGLKSLHKEISLPTQPQPTSSSSYLPQLEH